MRKCGADRSLHPLTAALGDCTFQSTSFSGICTDSSLSQVGRRPVFVVTLAVFALFQIGDAVAQNIWTIIIIRFFGVFGSL